MLTLPRLPRLRLGTRLSIGVVALVLASTFAITTAALFLVKQTLRNSIASEQFARISSIGDAIDQKFISRRILLRTFGASARAEASRGNRSLQAFIAEPTALSLAFENVFIVDPTGLLLASTAYPEKVGIMNVAAQGFFMDTLRTQAGIVSQPYRSQLAGTPKVAMTEPVFTQGGQLLFVIVGTINLQERSFLGELANTHFGKTGYMFILNTDGIMIDHPQQSRILKPSNAAGGTNLASQRAINGYEGVAEATSRDGVAALYAYKRISQTNWIVSARYPSTEAFEPLRQIEQAATLGALCVALLSGSIALAVLRRQLAPLALLHQHMRAAQAAPVHVPMPAPFGDDEIGDLARTLDLLLAQRQASADQLLANGRFMKNLADSLPVLIAYLDADRRYRFVNSTFIRWTGANPATVLGQTMEEVIGSQRYAERLVHLDSAFAGQRADFEVSIDAPGAPHHVQTSYVPDLRPDGTVAGVYCLASDVAAQKEVQGRLRDATRDARHANLAKSQFLANMSHEIRTPMNAVIGLTYLLGQSALDSGQADMVAKLRSAGKSLLGVINDVLDLSKIEAGELTIARTPFALGAVLEDVGGLAAMQASAKGIGFTIETPPDLPAAFEGDAPRICQILTNLVANAIKFTDHGRVEVTVAWRQCAAANPAPGEPLAELRLAVRDSGIGIADEVQPRLFSPFVQADSSTQRRFGGTGLGLSIVKRLVALMGGSIGLESTLGVGSTFSVELTLPVASASALAEATPVTVASCDLRGVRVLITDDSEINLEVASRILMLHGAEVTTAQDGQQAVDLLTRCTSSFDVVLMDVQMPGLDGYEATRRIRNQLGLRTLPVIALTAGALNNEHEGAGAAGMSDFIRKPFEARHLVRTVRRHARPLAPLDAVDVPGAATAFVENPRGMREDVAWPEIDGIDSADVRSRLAGDLPLFGSMLRRLLHEFTGIGEGLTAFELTGGSIGRQGEQLHRLKGSLHKLKGSAGTLGATLIRQLAELAEIAVSSGDSGTALVRIEELASRLRQLEADAAMVLGKLQAVDSAPLDAPSVSAESVARGLNELLARLHEQSINAVDCLREIAPQLRRRLGDEAFRRLQRQVEDLQFEDAIEVLEPLVPRVATQSG